MAAAVAYAPGLYGPARTVALALWVLLVSLTAPLVVPIILLFVQETDDNLPAWAWVYDTPDEKSLVGLYEPSIAATHQRWGWYVAAWVWFGLRNRAHGLASHYAQPAPAHWQGEMPGSANTATRLHEWHPSTGAWINARRTGALVWVAGWQVYASPTSPTGLEYRPVCTVKLRRQNITPTP